MEVDESFERGAARAVSTQDLGDAAPDRALPGPGRRTPDATIPGTFGTIHDTLRHLVRAEEGYFRILTGEELSAPLPDGPVPLDELAERIRRLGPRWEVLAQDPDLPGREVTTRDGWRIPGAVAMAQAIHHADDHRSHILSILGARGLEVPEPNGLDVWGYAGSAGQMQELELTSGD